MNVPRIWLCSTCLIDQELALFDPSAKEWIHIFVLGFSHSTGCHCIKHFQEIRAMKLRYYRICPLQSPSSQSSLHSFSLDSVMETRNNIQYYRSLEKSNYHMLPQVLSFSSGYSDFFPIKYRLIKDPISSFFCRRYNNHAIEVLVMWNHHSVFSAQWFPQDLLRPQGVKEMDEYLNRLLLFAPIWRYILNIVEVYILLIRFL